MIVFIEENHGHQSLIPVIEKGKRIIFVYPLPAFYDCDTNLEAKSTTNALPSIFAGFLSSVIGGELNNTIVQSTRPGRKKLERIERFLYQPHFTGFVHTDATYILVDDNYTLGGTLAMLRSYIVSNGSSVTAICALSSNQTENLLFPASQPTLKVVEDTYSHHINTYLTQEIGHDTTKFTESEANALLALCKKGRGRPGIEKLKHLRDSISSARAGKKK